MSQIERGTGEIDAIALPETPGALPAPAALKTLRLIVNPSATTVTSKRTHELTEVLGRRFEVEVTPTAGPGHATDLAREASLAGTDVVAVFAGDGTTNEAIRALAGTDVALAHLAGGNSNVLARMLLGSDPVKVAERLAVDDFSVLAIDLGDVDGRPFAFCAGVGLDAAVVRIVDADLARKHRFRWGAFWMEAVRVARADYFGQPSSLTVATPEGGSERGITAVVQNGSAYTYLGPRELQVSDGATLESGTIAAAALQEGLRWSDIPRLTWRIAGPVKASGHPRIQPLAPSPGPITVTCDRPLPLQVDGDFWREVDQATFSVRPAALRVLG